MTLAELRQAVRDRCDYPYEETEGRWSNEWLNRLINRAVRIFARETGYFIRPLFLPVNAGQREIRLPDEVSWGVMRVEWMGNALSPRSFHRMGALGETPGEPEAYLIAGRRLILDPPPDRSPTPDSRPADTAFQGGGGTENQPQGRAVKVKADSPTESNQVTIYGTVWGKEQEGVVTEAVSISGTAAVPTTRQDWGTILAYYCANPPAGTIHIKGKDDQDIVATNSQSWGYAMLQNKAAQWGPPIVRLIGRTRNRYVGIVGKYAGEDVCMSIRVPGSLWNSAQPWDSALYLTLKSGSPDTWVTIRGTRHGTGEPISETIKLTAGTEKTTTISDWGVIYDFTMDNDSHNGIDVLVYGDKSGVVAYIPASTTKYSVPYAWEGYGRRPLEYFTSILYGAVDETERVVVRAGSPLIIYAGVDPPQLAQDTDEPIELPRAYHEAIADGAAALAETIDLYDERIQDGAPVGLGSSRYAKWFWAAVQRLQLELEYSMPGRTDESTWETEWGWHGL